MITPPEHRARTRRYGRDGDDEKKSKSKKRRERRRLGRLAVEQDVDDRRDRDDDAVVVPPASLAKKKKPRRRRRRVLPSRIGEVFRSFRDEISLPADLAAAAPKQSSSSTPAIDYPEEGEILPTPEPEPARGGAGIGDGVTTPSLPTTPAAANTTTTTSGLFLPPPTSGLFDPEEGEILPTPEPEPEPARGAAGIGDGVTTPSLPTTPAAAFTTTTSGLFLPPGISPPPPPSSSSLSLQVFATPKKDKALLFFAASMPLPQPAVPADPNIISQKTDQLPARSSRATAPSLTLLPPPLPPPSTSSSLQELAPCDKNKALLSPASKLPPLPAVRPKKRKMSPATHQPPASSGRTTAPPLSLSPPPPPQQQKQPDVSERHEFLKKRFSKLIAKSQQQVIDDRHRDDLNGGQVVARAPEAEQPKPVVDKEAALCRSAVIAAERKRFGLQLRKTEMKAKRDALFFQNACREHVLRALGIDAAMERVVSSQRPRDGDGRPIVSPEHPCSPVEKLGLFLKPL